MSEPERPGIFDHQDDPVTPLPEPETPLAEGAPAAAPPPRTEPEQEQDLEAPAAEPEPVAVEEELPDVQPNDGLPEHAEGALRIPAGIRTFGASPNGARRSVGIAVSKFNGEITSKLLDGALAELEAAGVVPEAIELMPVPGAFELPLAAMALAKSRRYSCVLALGCVIRGETPHFDFVAAEAASGVQLAGLETGVPVSFGVLTCDTPAQAEARAGGPQGNKGAEAARSALEMVESLGQLRSTLAS